ncbi:MAG: hypothetical protein R2697_03420 [Ilumatobacteraceae bacterium]
MITVLVGALIIWFAYFAVTWLIDADFTIIRDTLRIFMIGSFPDDELWRLWIQAYLLMFAIGFGSGARARSSYEQSILQGVSATPQSILNLLRRFWPIILALVVFASFAKTISPMILVVTSVATAIVGRLAGWHAPAAVRLRSAYIATLLVIASMLVVAGTSKSGGIVVGLILFFWVHRVPTRRPGHVRRAGSGAMDRAHRRRTDRLLRDCLDRVRGLRLEGLGRALRQRVHRRRRYRTRPPARHPARTGAPIRTARREDRAGAVHRVRVQVPCCRC